MLKLSIESLKEIKTQVEGGFKPLPCRVQVYDYGRKLRFKVFDRDYDIAVEVSDLVLEDLVDGSYVAEIIEKACPRAGSGRIREDEISKHYRESTGMCQLLAGSPATCSCSLPDTDKLTS